MRVSIDLLLGWVRNKLNNSMERIEVFINKRKPYIVQRKSKLALVS